VIFETLRQMESNPQIKARLSQIQYLVVDEYQDINNLQENSV
jgi:superfamily I DNA/RNA helicase